MSSKAISCLFVNEGSPIFLVVLYKTYVLAFISCKRGLEYFVVVLYQTYSIE